MDIEDDLTELKTLLQTGLVEPLNTIDNEIDRLTEDSKTKSNEELQQLFGFDRTDYTSKLHPLPDVNRTLWKTVKSMIKVLRNGGNHIERVFDDILFLDPPDTFEGALEYAVMFKVNIELAPDNEDRSITIELYNRVFNDHRYD